MVQQIKSEVLDNRRAGDYHVLAMQGGAGTHADRMIE